MTLDTLDYGAEAGTLTNTSLERLGIHKINYDKVMSLTEGYGLTHMSVELLDGKVIDLGNYNISEARDMIRNTIFGTAEGFKTIFDYIEGE